MNNWFALDTDGSPTWAPLEGNSAVPAVGTLRAVGQQPSATLTGQYAALPASGALRLVGATPTVISEFVIDGGGTIQYFVERDLTVTYHVFGWVARDLTLVYQIPAIFTPSVGTLRVVGQTPTATASTITFALPNVGTLRFTGQQPTAAWTGLQSAAPTTGALRLVGQVPLSVPSLDPKVASPTIGTFRFVGQAPLVDLAQKFAAPSVGTLRIRGLGAVERDLVLTWQDFAVGVESDLTLFWQRSAYLTSDLTLTWQTYSAATGIQISESTNVVSLSDARKTINVIESRSEINLRIAA